MTGLRPGPTQQRPFRLRSHEKERRFGRCPVKSRARKLNTVSAATPIRRPKTVGGISTISEAIKSLRNAQPSPQWPTCRCNHRKTRACRASIGLLLGVSGYITLNYAAGGAEYRTCPPPPTYTPNLFPQSPIIDMYVCLRIWYSSIKCVV